MIIDNTITKILNATKQLRNDTPIIPPQLNIHPLPPQIFDPIMTTIEYSLPSPPTTHHCPFTCEMTIPHTSRHRQLATRTRLDRLTSVVTRSIAGDIVLVLLLNIVVV